ncbi:hypothetical protein ACLB2K_049370 [Fragaria x ananassa]
MGLPNNDYYYVKDINFALSTITLVDIDIVDQTCPRATHSMSVGTLPFDYSPLDVNLSFYFNCTSFFYSILVPPITCLGSYGTKKSYVFKEGEEPKVFDWSENCEENVVVTVKETEITRSIAINELSGAFGVAMNKGFVLNWTKAKECGSCEINGGFCGYNNTARQVLCFCKDGSIGTPSNGLCNKDTFPAISREYPAGSVRPFPAIPVPRALYIQNMLTTTFGDAFVNKLTLRDTTDYSPWCTVVSSVQA